MMQQKKALKKVSSSKKTKTIEVIGPQADENFMDWYTGASSYDVKINEGFKTAFKDSEILCDNGRDHVKIKNTFTQRFIRIDEEGGVFADASEDEASVFEKYDWGWGYINYMSQASGKMLTEDDGNWKCTAKDACMWFVRPIMRPNKVEGKEGFKTLRDDWNTNCVRLALYPRKNMGYCAGGNQAYLKKLVCSGIEAATELGMYVMVDWHVLNYNPNDLLQEAMVFFNEISQIYANYDNVIYELCNEPVGAKWETAIKPYAEKLIPVIRKNAPDALIVCGTNTWSQELEGPLNVPQRELWFDLIKKYNISHMNWSLANKAETASIIRPDCTKVSDWDESELTESGRLIRDHFKTLNR